MGFVVFVGGVMWTGGFLVLVGLGGLCAGVVSASGGGGLWRAFGGGLSIW